jgi:outer membrane protein OmpA-like peptidoglycan-associated protein
MNETQAHRALALALAAVLLATAGACETTGKRTAVGAGAGGAVGAGAGALLGGKKHRLAGALVGAGVGALAGGSIGLYLDKQQKELEAARVAEVRRTENGLVVKMASDILFESGSSALKPKSVDDLEKIADVVAKYADDRVKIYGHTDAEGGKAYNEELSLRRADAVKRVLVGRGVQEKQITALGMGEAQPVSTNATAAGRTRNRRVELHIDVPNAT